MIVRARIETQKDWLFHEELPEKYTPSRKLSEKQTTIHDYPVDMNNYQLSTNGLFLFYSDMKFDEVVDIHTEIEGEAVASQFIFRNDAANGIKSKFSVKRGRHNIRAFRFYSDSYPIPADVEFSYLLVVLSKDYYSNLVDIHAVLQKDLIHEVAMGQYTSLTEQDLYVTPEMLKTIEDIRQCKRDGELKKMFTDARILELLLFQLEQVQHQDKISQESLLNDDDVQKLEAARRILELQYAQPPTHKQLSKMVLLNEFKLRHGFKKFFSTTIYEYVTRIRMEEARRLIIEERMNIYEVSTLIGFKHQGNFTNAFKKFYGLAPSELRV